MNPARWSKDSANPVRQRNLHQSIFFATEAEDDGGTEAEYNVETESKDDGGTEAKDNGGIESKDDSGTESKDNVGAKNFSPQPPVNPARWTKDKSSSAIAERQECLIAFVRENLIK